MRQSAGWLWVFALAGCGGPAASAVSDFDGKTATEEQPLYVVARSAKPRDLTPATTDVAQLARDNASFGADFYKVATKGSTANTVISPYSASVTMAMLYNGAAPITGAEIATAMHFTLPTDRLNAAFNATDLALHAHGPELTLAVASSLWTDPGAVSSGYLDTLSTSYDTGIFYPSIPTAPDAARLAINQWTAKQTDQKITELLPPHSIGGSADFVMTSLVLVNAIDFEARWTTAFSAGATTPGDFKGLDGVVFQAPMMHGGGATAHATAAEYEAYELPYGGGASLVVIVPHEGKFASVEANLSGDFITSVFGALAPSPFSVSMPLFSIHSPAPLGDTLATLGVHHAFNRENNFPVLGDEKFISGAFQTARIDVMEDGTKAVAATAVVVSTTPSAAPQRPPPVTIASPFLFVVRDVPTNTVLFMGRLTDPR